MENVLEKLEDEYVVRFDLCDNKKTLLVVECSESYYSFPLNKSQAQKLIDELQELVNQMDG